MNVIVAYLQPFQLDDMVDALRRVQGCPGLSVSEVQGLGCSGAHPPRKGENTAASQETAGAGSSRACSTRTLTTYPQGVYSPPLSMVTRKTGRTLRVLDATFVPDERKAEIRKRLARLKGQIEGVERMLAQNRPCAEILTQISAAQAALRGAGRVMVRNYLERCATTAIKEGRGQEVYDEVMDLVFKVTR